MNSNVNSPLKHTKHGESVFEALLDLGGKATFSELLRHISRTVKQPEGVIQAEVKYVLRASVLNGYVVRHGKNYLISRSCRTWHTDSGSTNSRKNEENGNETSFRTFGFPFWWNRFWNRFIVVKGKDRSSSYRKQNDNFLTCDSSDLNHMETILKVKTEDDFSVNVILKSDSTVSTEGKEEIQEIQGEPEFNSSIPEEDEKCDSFIDSFVTEIDAKVNPKEELKVNDSSHSIESVKDFDEDTELFWTIDEPVHDDCMY